MENHDTELDLQPFALEVADRVIGCDICGKPSALVGDHIPIDLLCPWCRGSTDPDTPGANKLYINDSIRYK